MESFKSFCNSCGQDTNHSILKDYQKSNHVNISSSEQNEEYHNLGVSHYQIVTCVGCDLISFKCVDISNSYVDLNENGNMEISNNKTFIRYYPDKSINRIQEKMIVGLPFSIRSVYREIIDSYNFNLNILCAAGLRSIVEGIVSDQEIRGISLGEKINNLSKIRLISKELSSSLHGHKFLGNHALHRLEIPDKSELKGAIELIETCLETIYSVPIKHSKLKRSISKRMGD